MAKTLYVTDLDGTLLNSEERVSARSLAVIEGLLVKGMRFTIATARPIEAAKRVVGPLRLSAPAVVADGAFIMEFETERALYTNLFAAGDISLVRDVLEQYDIHPLVYTYADGMEKTTWVQGLENQGTLTFLGERAGEKRMQPTVDAAGLYDGEIYCLCAMGTREHLLPAYAALCDHLAYQCLLIKSLYQDYHFLQISPATTTKAHALQRLCAMEGFDKIVAFGDGVNDLQMFALADECYAPENALPELKALATGIIGSNDADGVAEWLLRHAEV